MVIALALMLKHMLKVADQLPIGTGRNGGLVHVKGTGKSSSNAIEIQVSGR
jgi:hypothetical protein